MSDKKDKKEKRGFFGAKKSGDASVRKSKSFKRIRGLLKGSKSKKTLEKKEKQRDEGDTVYDVDVEDRSIMTRQTVEAPKPFLLKIVLLLMDPVTRRFELLQLEFDSLNATVNDILVQIPVSVTEEALREQKYVAICGPDAKEKSPTEMLSSFCAGNGVLVAIPEGLQARECVRLATPILSDSKVTQMLKASGINASEWKDDVKSKSVPEARQNKSAPTKKTRGGGTALTILVIALLAAGLQVFHLYISAPIQRGNVVSPNIWLRECGLNFFSCDKESYFRIKDGKAIRTNGRNEVMWVMEGAACTSGECQNGMQVKSDGSILIGGKPVTHVTMYKEAALSPWPFAEEPLVKTRHAKILVN
ncbi:hypothetical protein FisN_10Hh187 [Fistulifera solaris]|uniref:Uncharacterized protein n=1 Tax=Fistulifera solaris TaxID=1519565 RepID=A0A1Z5JXJ4_FISSO|nr:hypothetical protein FisN_10Hh187 [Fistulifera solaris]|eukprot:GAX18606.1 hypothetical protein FisN_10Hh187 [Fistulifera solaris]